ncbi:MAG: DNA methyltransferase [Anaerolineae bacterium]
MTITLLYTRCEEGERGGEMADTRKAENEVTRTGLYWPGKRTEVERVALPFQVVETVNVSRATREEAPLFAAIQGDEAEGWRNKLIWGENKYIMASLLDQGFAGKINLIYIDPPFATGADFSVNIKVGDEEWTKEASVIEEKAYRDTWGKGLDSYLQMMYDRLVLMRELLAEDGTIYVHVAYHVGHYVKVILDEIFGKDNLRNEIIWYYNSGPRAALDFGRRHDTILRYSRTDTYKLNADEVREAYSPNINIPASKAHYYHPLGKVADDVWRINIISQNDKRERLDFPTQKGGILDFV